MAKNITDDMELKQKTLKFIEETTKLGYWCIHSILLSPWDKKKLIIEVESPKIFNDENKITSYTPKKTLRNEAKILEIITNQPGISPKEISEKTEDIMSSRALSDRLKSMINKGIIRTKSKGNNKNDPTRKYYPINHE